MGRRIRLTGTKDATGRLLSVTFSDDRGGTFTLPVTDEDQMNDEVFDTTTICECGARQVTLREWLAKDGAH